MTLARFNEMIASTIINDDAPIKAGSSLGRVPSTVPFPAYPQDDRNSLPEHEY